VGERLRAQRWNYFLALWSCAEHVYLS